MLNCGPVVVRIGGSLTQAGDGGARLRAWLAACVAARRAAAVVLVPGGGAFADAVRAAQPALGLSDRAAHRMALLAMEQAAAAFCDLEPACLGCCSAAAIGAALGSGRLPVWLPSRMALADPAIPESWEVTSDSLAAWLAARLGAARLMLVKSAPPPPGGPGEWAAAGHVDAAFPGFAARFPGTVECLGPDDTARLAPRALPDAA